MHSFLLHSTLYEYITLHQVSLAKLDRLVVGVRMQQMYTPTTTEGKFEIEGCTSDVHPPIRTPNPNAIERPPIAGQAWRVYIYTPP